MVIMENYFPHEKCRELWLKIDQLHLSYLEMDESPEKIIHRAKLEESVADFLFLAPHRDKFVFAETEDVLYRSATFKKDFSGYKAATGWNALQIYASNLLTQPWRKEYRQIKTYCGFYKHQIEANLVGAETVFEAMGYKRLGNGILVLEGPICPDRVSNISKDCLVAYMECQILKHIWEEVNQVFNISWLDILENRANYPGNIDQCIKNIVFKYNSKTNQQPIRSTRASEPYETRHQPATPTSQVSVSNSHMSVPNSHTYAGLASHNHVALPAVLIPPGSYCVPRTNGYPTTFATSYGYGTYPAHMPIIKQQPLSVATANGYYYPPHMPVLPPVYPVPTAQLIEVDSRSNGYDVADEGSHSSRARRSRLESSNGTLENNRVVRSEDSARNGVAIVQDAKQPDSAEDWDYVYRNLERQGYSKDLGERGDVIGLSVSDQQRKQLSKESKKVKATNLDEVMHSLSINERPLKMTEALEQMEKKPVEKNTLPKERRHSQGSSYENVVANDSLKQTKPVSRTPQNIAAQPKLIQENVEVDVVPTTSSTVSLEVKKANKDKEKVSVSDSKWECKSCTYLNNIAKDICEICSKSRHMGQEQLMEVGGPECSKCTLVNSRSAKVCQACDNSLKNSPTYI